MDVVVGDDLACALLDDGAPFCTPTGPPFLAAPSGGMERHGELRFDADAPVVCASRNGSVRCAGEHYAFLDRQLDEVPEGLAVAARGAVCTWTGSEASCWESSQPPACDGPEFRHWLSGEARCVSRVSVRRFPARISTLELGLRRGCALLDNQELWCWGAPWGWNATGPPEAPREPTLAMTDVVSLSVSDLFFCVGTATGSVRCWGDVGSKSPVATAPPGDVVMKPL